MATKQQKENNQLLLFALVGVGIYFYTRKKYTVTIEPLPPGEFDNTLMDVPATNTPAQILYLDDAYQQYEGMLSGAPGARSNPPKKNRTVI